jgi:[protein-PII] uridylyltransferase
MVSKTAMLEMRLIKGDKKIFKKLREQFLKKCLQHQKRDYLSWRLKDLQLMHEKFGKTVFMQEPHIKSGKGGLRDFQNILWIARVDGRAETLSRLVELKYLGGSERRKLEKNYSFLLSVRQEMHDQEKRAQDRLTLRLQGIVATALGYPQKNILSRSEAFMKDYYEKTRESYFITSLVLERMKLLERRRNVITSYLSKKFNAEKIDGFLLRKGNLFPESQTIFNKNPHRMMKVFYLAQTRGVDFSPELSDLIRRRLLLVDQRFQTAVENRTVFFLILARKGEVGRTLRLMHDLGFLGKYLPEFGALTCLVQHEFYHHYTADEHTLVSIEELDRLLLSSNQKLVRYSTLFKNLDDPAILYLSLLLHDIGKAAYVPKHAKASVAGAQKIAGRLDLSGERRQRLLTLVAHHGELAAVARTRDLEDITTISSFAKIVQTVPTLHALMLLTLADGMGVGEEQWSDWKEQLVWNLFEKTKNYLEKGDHFLTESDASRLSMEKQVRGLLGAGFSEEISTHFEQMPERYFRMMEPRLLAEHLQLARKFFERFQQQGNILEAEIFWREHGEQGYTEVWICGWDRRYLLEKIAASFLIAGINILSADIFTRTDDLTIDIFRVNSIRRDAVINEKEKKTMERNLQLFLKTTEKPLFKKPEPYSLKQWQSTCEERGEQRVVIDAHSHPIYTLVEVEAPDRQGLFYDLVGVLSQHGLFIDLARIATEMRAAFDTFYVLNAEGKKIEDGADSQLLQQQLLSACQLKK